MRNNPGESVFMNQADFNEAELRLQAHLYLLDDPILDAADFEARLSEDGRLGEILAEAVNELEAIRTAHQIIASQSSATRLTGSPSIRTPVSSNWTWPAALAAGIVIAAFIGFRSIKPDIDIDDGLLAVGDTASSVEPIDVALEPMVVHSMISEWADMQINALGEPPALIGSLPDSELAWLKTSDELVDREVPDWLVLAASVGGDIETAESDLN